MTPETDTTTLTPVRCGRCESRIHIIVARFYPDGLEIRPAVMYACDCTEAGTEPADFPDYWPVDDD